MDFCSTWNRESDSLWRMSKTFRPWDVEQRVLLSVHELVPAGHLAHFVRDTVREDLDLSRIMETYTEERGYPPYQSHDDGGTFALCLQPRRVLLAQDRAGL